MRLDFFDLALFLAIVETGSMTQGASHCAISLQAASERIKKLERSVDLTLFSRHASGVRLTPAGEVFRRHAEHLLKQLDQLQIDLEPFALEQQQQVQLWCNSSAQSEYLPQLLAQFLKAHPHIQIELKEAESSDMITALSVSQAKLGIVTNFFDAQDLETQVLWEDNLVLICPKAHPIQQQRPIALLECLQYPFIGLMSHHSLQQSIETQAKLLGQVIQYRLRLPNFSAIAQMVTDGIGIAIMPKRAATRLALEYKFDQVEILGAWANRKLQLAAQNFAQLPPAYQLLIQYLIQNKSLNT